MSWTEVYTRCMDGEFVRGSHCPRDGSSTACSVWVSDAVEALRKEGLTPALDSLVERGYPGDPSNLIVVTFSGHDEAPDWFRPEG